MNVLSYLSDEVYLSELNIAGTHDSATAWVAMENVARCQEKTISEQLMMGIRLLDIRLTKKGDEFYLVILHKKEEIIFAYNSIMYYCKELDNAT